MRGQTRTVTRRPAARASPPPSPSASDSESASPARPAKRRKTASSTSSKIDAYRKILHQSTADLKPSLPPTRCHTLAYHKPLLLDGGRGADGRAAFLSWFDSVSATRAMPWRKPWVNPADFSSDDDAALRRTLEKRAYEVWISEIMLQQTRVAVVIEYWNRWMERWPTIQDLAAATADDVLAAWRGLGYYSRATRIHEAAKLAVGDSSMRGLLPSSAKDLADRIPGVGRYTAGAISCIAFGRPAPMVDGNVLRVLSRQLGLYGNIKTDKAVIDMIWVAAEELVNAVALDGQDDKTVTPDDTRSDGPGRWGQALMELGSTVCAPRPNCGECPITATCRAYSEGLALSNKSKNTEDIITDMEDMCGVCEPFDETDDIENQPPAAAKKGGKQATLSAFFTKPASTKPPAKAAKVDVEAIANHARKFPVKVAKKAVREEQTLVCAVVRGDGRHLIHKRPAKGLLAGLWEFPSSMLERDVTASQRQKLAKEFIAGVLDEEEVEHVGELGSVPWLFSHIKLTMHVHLFRLEGTKDVGVGGTASGRWSEEVDTESMGTGMRKCWDLVKEAA
ncbi:uncharacterized protein LMH87_008431 [Akanthomyces muscarius]|uniref:Adenine DNA glycosylase n=1 Tax=Akanthomyces muscarius TaxID=2231603 RepID=A0A9W8QM31_AKAMU|nr:uncharacterized protein LMH87_008431 [Akanthomyces muscarius]KAJ4159533.1 hypothetical protein LMH87_008431 [Akanthomyces muscarius]